METIDKRNRLDAEPFTYNCLKNGTVHIFWNQRRIKTLSSKEAQAFLARVQAADGKERQLILAKVTGNFKHGNEKDGKR